MIVKIDNRETARICDAINFYKHDHKIVIDELPIGDFIFQDENNSVVFEYKTITDFLFSVREGRVFDQAIRQSKHFKYHFVIIEGIYNGNQKIISADDYYESISRLNTITTVLTSPSKLLSFTLMEKQAMTCLENPLLKQPSFKSSNVAYNYLMLIKGIDKVKAHTICKRLNLKTFEDLRNVTQKN